MLFSNNFIPFDKYEKQKSKNTVYCFRFKTVFWVVFFKAFVHRIFIGLVLVNLNF